VQHGAHGPQAVSYTHLDVYKRQFHDMGVARGVVADEIARATDGLRGLSLIHI